VSAKQFAVPALALLSLLAGCETLTRESTQKLQIEALDAHDRPVRGLVCKIGDAPATFTLPASGVVVRRSGANLEIDCHNGTQVARATVVPRRDGVEQALIPFGSVAVAIDHISGKLYDYPTTLRLRLGQHVTLEHGGEARVAKSESLPGAPVDVAAAAPAAPAKPVVAKAKPVSTTRAPAAVRVATTAPAPAKLQVADASTSRPSAPPTW
jgi:hypothetical protein